MPINIDPEKAREYFKRHTDYDPDDPNERRAMFRAYVFMNVGALVGLGGLIWLVSSGALPALSVVVVGIAGFCVGAARYAALLYRG